MSSQSRSSCRASQAVMSSESSCAVRLAWARHVERVESSRAKWNLGYTDRLIESVNVDDITAAAKAVRLTNVPVGMWLQ